jgi:Dyp-type peroxidase family
MTPLDLKNIQGNILRGYNVPHAFHLFLKVPDASAGRAFLAETVDEVRDAERWVAETEVAINVAITYAGLRALEVEKGILDELPEAFREPIRIRAPLVLGDTGPSGPSSWDRGIGTVGSHVLVLVSARDVWAMKRRVRDIRARAHAHGLDVVHDQEVGALPTRREHFGWSDGFGQPAIEGVPGKRPRAGRGAPCEDGIGWRDLKAGEFILGYRDEDGQVLSGPAAPLLHNGSFMVYRKLYQNVARFRKALYEEARRYGEATLPGVPLTPAKLDELYEVMAAKVVGRWRDGASIELEPSRAGVMKLGDDEEDDPDNDFRYRSADPDGFHCPKGAHIRRTNPRDEFETNGKSAARHRIIRRGMPYGEFLDGLVDDGEDRGLIFICFNADFERQFELIQAHWCNDGNAFGLGDDKDYLLGDNEGRCRFTIQGKPPYFAKAQPNIVLTRGCEYLLMPGINALRYLARPLPPQRRPRRPATLPTLEQVPRGEPEAIAEVIAIIREKLLSDYGANSPALRGQHPKSHGCVTAELEVEPGLPADLAHGIFATGGAKYDALVRFSGSHAPPRSDRRRDAHGMSIKVMGVKGEKILPDAEEQDTQDFTLVNHDVFFSRDAADYVKFAKLATGSGSRLRSLWAQLSFFFPRRLREAVNLVKVISQNVTNPLQIRYWSQTPYALGPHAVKYSAIPRTGPSAAPPGPRGDNSLAEALAHQLESGCAAFDLVVQLQRDKERMPVENPTIRWRESDSPFRKVATIRIPCQRDFTSQAVRNRMESMVFTPWHSLPEHKPLGGINRLRGEVYETIAELRRGMNSVR